MTAVDLEKVLIHFQILALSKGSINKHSLGATLYTDCNNNNKSDNRQISMEIRPRITSKTQKNLF